MWSISLETAEVEKNLIQAPCGQRRWSIHSVAEMSRSTFSVKSEVDVIFTTESRAAFYSDL